MCSDPETWRWIDYRKHKVPPWLRDAPADEIDRATAGRPSLYYPSVNQRDLERQVAERGICVRSAKPATDYKIMEFVEPIGASEGKSSRWVMVQQTSGEFHGRPIAEHEYRRRLASPAKCERGDK